MNGLVDWLTSSQTLAGVLVGSFLTWLLGFVADSRRRREEKESRHRTACKSFLTAIGHVYGGFASLTSAQDYRNRIDYLHTLRDRFTEAAADFDLESRDSMKEPAKNLTDAVLQVIEVATAFFVARDRNILKARLNQDQLLTQDETFRQVSQSFQEARKKFVEAGRDLRERKSSSPGVEETA